MSRTRPGTLRSRAYAQARNQKIAATMPNCPAAPASGQSTEDAAEIVSRRRGGGTPVHWRSRSPGEPGGPPPCCWPGDALGAPSDCLGRRRRDPYRCLAADGERRFAGGKFKPLPWTSAADCVRRRRRPPRCREHVMLGFSQITRPRTSVAVSAPGGGTADGHDRPPLGLWRQAHWPWVIWEAR